MAAERREELARAPIGDRKAEHITIATSQPVEPGISASWNDVALVHNCLPEIDLDEVDLSVEFLGRKLSAPLLISSMTGGHALARSINAVLAEVAERFGLAMGVGSQRAYLKDRSSADTYSVVRDAAPSAYIVGNVGAPQLIPQGDQPPLSVDQVRQLVDLIKADALAVHLNYLQEMIQPEGDTRARGALAAIRELGASIGVPLIAKETGAGIAPAQADQLRAAGVQALDVGGLGGTSFAVVEAQRARLRDKQAKAALGELFGAWGIPTMAAIPLAVSTGLPVIGSGGIRSGLDAARALALGATLVGVARPLLVVAQQGVAATAEWVERFLDELRTALFLTGSPTPAAICGKAILLGRTKDWVEGLARASK
ncbi:MAG TPA: type 2 isopentenyl-diphosphate Delta-isomerase [Chloroflexota bacterium]|nr:type 2 isopentenyl-diphosphate Delta-isomerase [Chloroflexota bacterium]